MKIADVCFKADKIKIGEQEEDIKYYKFRIIELKDIYGHESSGEADFIKSVIANNKARPLSFCLKFTFLRLLCFISNLYGMAS